MISDLEYFQKRHNMAGNFPYATESLNSLKVSKSTGESLTVIPWNFSGTNPLVSFTLNENMFSPLMTGTMIIRDTGEWLRTYSVKPSDEIIINLNAKSVSGDLNRDRQESNIKNYSLVFEVTNVKNTITLSSDEYQSDSETIKALTIEFISKSVLNKEFLSSLLENENFIGPIYSNTVEKFTLKGTEPTKVQLKGFNDYIQEKFNIRINGDRTWNYCYLKKNNVSYPWGKIKGQPTILQTLQYLAENAVSFKNNSAVNYLFWQDLNGYNFKCINSLIENDQTSETLVFNIGGGQFSPSTIHAFETISEFDNLDLLNSNVYFSWYERIIPNYKDPYLDFIDTSLGLSRQNIVFDIKDEYNKFSHIEQNSLLTGSLSGNTLYSNLSQSQRTDDDIYGFYSKNRYNTPFAQTWEYLGLSADTRLSNVVWQNQYDLDDEVYPQILYAYDKLIKKSLIINREKYTKLKNIKRKWEVYRCSICCTDQIGGTTDQLILQNLSTNSNDYSYYFGVTGAFKEFSNEYGVLAAGSFSDVVNYDKGITFNNGLTLSYDMNSYPYNQTIEEFYNLKSDIESVTKNIDDSLEKYQKELTEVDLYISAIEAFNSKVDGWILASTQFAYSNLTPPYKKTCSSRDTNPDADYWGPDTGDECCNNLDAMQSVVEQGNCSQAYSIPFVLYGTEEAPYTTDIHYRDRNISNGELVFNFGRDCNIGFLPLYVNLRYNSGEFPKLFSGHWDSLIEYQQDDFNTGFPWYVTADAGCPILLDGPVASDLPFQKPEFLYECTKTKLMTGRINSSGNYFSTHEYGELRSWNVIGEADWLDVGLQTGVEEGTVWCEACLDPLALEYAKYEYIKILKEKKLRQFVLGELILKLTTLKNSFTLKYNEFLNRKAFFISKNPFDKEVPGNIVDKKSELSLFNIKSIKRKSIRGSKYEILAKRIGLTGGSGATAIYQHKIYFGDDQSRNPGITGNHPYYDQKFKGFTSGAYASKSGFDIKKLDFVDILYYDNEFDKFVAVPGLVSNDSRPGNIPSEVPGSLMYDSENISYPSPYTIDPNGSLSNYFGLDLTEATNKLNVFVDDAENIPSLEKEKISSFVRIEFINPIGLDRLSDFPSGFIRDAGSEYFLPYLVQLTDGPNGRQTIQNNAVVIGIDPYGFDVAVKKNKTKNTYSDYKEWGNYWWYTPLNKLRLANKTKDIHDMSLWAEPAFENENTYFENNGEYLYNIGEDFTEFDNYSGIASQVFRGNTEAYRYGSFYPSLNVNTLYGIVSEAIDDIDDPKKYFLPIANNTFIGRNVEITKTADTETINYAKYGSYNLLGSHLHYNNRRSWYDFAYPTKAHFDTILTNIANYNNVGGDALKTKTLLKSNDIVAFAGNDFVLNFQNSLALKNTSALQTFLSQNEITNLHVDDIFDIEQLNQLKGLTLNNGILSDNIERYLNGDLLIYRPGLVTSDVWKYDIFGESEYGIISPPTLPPEYDLFDNNFAAQFVVFGKSSGSNICKDLGLKCLNPNGKVDNSNCENNDPYCNCPGKNLIPTEAEPSYKQLAIAFEETKECSLIEKYLGKDYLGCMLSDPENITSCNCPEQGEQYSIFLNTIRSNATFYATPPKTPLRRQAQMSLFNAQRAVMTIYPNDSLKIGDLITVARQTALDGKDTVNGKWMITGISRMFKSINIELMTVTLFRDSIK